MNRKQFLEKISTNWIAIVVCFVTACFIYFFHQIATLEKRTITVPLTVKNEGSMIVSGDGKYHYIKVTVRGKPEQIASISEKDLTAYVDVTSQTKSGKFEFPVLIDPDKRLLLMEPLEIVSNPNVISLTLEPKVTKYVKVNPSVAGEPAHGFKQVSLKVEPQFTEVTGPKSMVESLEYVQTGMVSVEQAKSEVSKTVGLINSNSLITMDLRTAYTVTVGISPEGMVRNVNGITVSYENVLDDIEIVSEPVKVDVVLEGEVLTLENTDFSTVKAYADCTDVVDEGDFELRVRIAVPAGIKVDEQSLEFIKVKAVKKIYEESQEEEPLAEMENISE